MKASVLGAIAVLLSAVVPPAHAAEPNGYWSVATSEGEIRLGLVFPEFSVNEFAGVMFACHPGKPNVTLLVDVSSTPPAGSTVDILLTMPNRVGRYRGTVEIMQVDDRVIARSATTFQDPLFGDLEKATSFSMTVAGQKNDLPVREVGPMVRRFLSSCRAPAGSRAQ